MQYTQATLGRGDDALDSRRCRNMSGIINHAAASHGTPERAPEPLTIAWLPAANGGTTGNPRNVHLRQQQSAVQYRSMSGQLGVPVCPSESQCPLWPQRAPRIHL
eukprot:15393639-Alexandrium_andersonii.AAC.1